MQPENNNQPAQEPEAPGLTQEPNVQTQAFTPPQFNVTTSANSAQPEQPPINPATQPSSPMGAPVSSPKTGASKKLIIMIAVGILLLAGIVTAVFLLTKDDTTSNKSNNTSSNQSTMNNSEDNKSDDKQPNDPPKTTEKEVGGSISDGPLKYTIAVNKIVTNVPFNSSASSYVTDESVGVLIEVTASNNSDYYTSIGSYDFKIVTSSGSSEYESSYNLTDYAKEKGYTLLSSKSVSRGDTVTAWLGFEVPKDEASNLKLRYERQERKGSDGTVLAAVKVEVPLN